MQPAVPGYCLVLAFAPSSSLKLENHKHLEMWWILNQVPICLPAAQIRVIAFDLPDNEMCILSVCFSKQVEKERCDVSWATLVCMHHQRAQPGDR